MVVSALLIFTLDGLSIQTYGYDKCVIPARGTGVYYIGPELRVDVGVMFDSSRSSIDGSEWENNTENIVDDNDDLRASSPICISAHDDDIAQTNKFVHVLHEKHGDHFYQSALNDFKAALAQADRLPGARELVWSAITNLRTKLQQKEVELSVSDKSLAATSSVTSPKAQASSTVTMRALRQRSSGGRILFSHESRKRKRRKGSQVSEC